VETKLISLDSIKLDPNQPRKIVNERAVENLAKSLKVEGLIHPIEVDKNFTIVVGELRFRAAKSLGWKEIKATINDKPLPPYERLRRQMAENLQQSGAQGGGQPMNAIDTAKAWARLYELKTGKTYSPGEQVIRDPKTGAWLEGQFKTIADEVGVDKVSVWEYLKLLEQPNYIIESIARKVNPVPRTYYREAERTPEAYREKVKVAIAEGKIQNREDIVRFAKLAKAKPTMAEVEFLRLTAKQNADANRVLNRSVELELVLNHCEPNKFSRQDKFMITGQLTATLNSIKIFLTKMNEPN
jgi:hypothetical protein